MPDDGVKSATIVVAPCAGHDGATFFSVVVLDSLGRWYMTVSPFGGKYPAVEYAEKSFNLPECDRDSFAIEDEFIELTKGGEKHERVIITTKRPKTHGGFLTVITKGNSKVK
jgi:hypothetical protein